MKQVHISDRQTSFIFYLVHQGKGRTEAARLAGFAAPPLATTICKDLQLIISFVINKYIIGSNSISNTKKQIASCARACAYLHFVRLYYAPH